MRRLFTAHPDAVGETYSEHLKVASGFGVQMIAGGLACVLHGIFPFLFVKTGSHAVAELYNRMIVNRDQRK